MFAVPALGSRTGRRRRNLQQGRNKSRGAPRITYCSLCLFQAQDSVEFDVHKNEPRHAYNYLLYQFKEHRARKSKDRHGVKIEMTCDGKDLPNTKDGTVKTILDPNRRDVVYHFNVRNTGENRQTPLTLMKVMLLHPYEAFTIHDEQNVSRERCHISLQPGSSYQVSVKFENCGTGSYGVPVCFVMDREDLREKDRPFYIVRLMVVNVIESDTNTVEVMEQKESPFTGEKWLGMEIIVYGTMPDGRPINRLLGYEIPGDLYELFVHNFTTYPEMDYYLSGVLLEKLNLLAGPFPENPHYYADMFHTLLYYEEYTETQQVEMYNMADVPVKVIDQTHIEFEVPGLAEKRPSVLKGDLIYLRVSFGKDQVEKVQYEGVVSDVRDTVVWVAGFHESLLERIVAEPGIRFDVHFTVNRFTFFVLHRAIDVFIEDNFHELIMPSGMCYPPLPLRSSIRFINPLIETNPEQAKAVTNIVLGTSRPAPYIIHGPPGTGKTMTVVEAILQVKKLVKNSYILVCAPANSACDLLAQKLAPHCTTKELLRLHSSSRDWDTVPKDLHPYSNRDKETYYFPPNKELLQYRIIVCTLISSGRLLPRDDRGSERLFHFTHVFIDESGQAMEPETLVPIAGILSFVDKQEAGGQVILAGDPLQLGPTCTIKIANVKFLEKSLMERLMNDCDLYARKEREDGQHYDDKYITKLCRNFRSHEQILYLPNFHFYHEDLIAECGPEVTNDTVKNFTNDAQKNKPIVFHGVLGQEKREGRSPSYFNLYEIRVVLEYVKKLLEGGSDRARVEQNEIGIIAPYIRQVYKLKAKLKENNWGNIEVGTTETFQGREKRVIIISTVRSNRNLLDFDGRYSLGFVANAKRFNVAITRARALLIVVGNPFLLESDPYWCDLINFTIELDSYRGCRYTSRNTPEWMEYVKKRIQSLLGS